MTGKKRYSMRSLKDAASLVDTWLFDHPKAFIMQPSAFPPNCTWCGTKLKVIKNLWRHCPQCDDPNGGEQP